MQATGELQDHHHYQQRQQHEEGQEDRWSTLLCDVLLPHLTSEQQQEPAPSHTAGTIHRLDRRHRQAARASLRHLPLWRYECNRSRLQLLQQEAKYHTDRAAAARRAAAVGTLPELPWNLLSAASHITSLKVHAYQLVPLNFSCMSVTPAAQTTSNRQSSSSSSSSNQGGTQAGMLCAGLGRLRSLSVVNIDTCSYAWLLGLLLGRCPQLTQLVLSMCDRMMGPEGLNPGAQLLDGWDVAASRAADAAAEEGIEATALQLPPIQHLELSGPCHGLLDAWLSLPGAAARLTALHLTGGSAPGLSSHQLQACSSLQELVIESRPSHAEDHLGPDVPRHLVHLTALTKLVLEGCGLTALPGSLWCLTGLRHLNLAHSRVGHTLPSDISALRQLRVLDLTHTWLRELPRPLGAWLPELEDLRIAGTFVWRVPNSLTRLTRLEASCFVRYVSYLQHLVQLKELVIEYSDLRPPLQELSRLTALETLRLEWRDGVSREWTSPVSLQGALPRLRWLSLSKAPLAVLCALGGAGMGHLTQLHLWGLEPTCMGSIQQLGVLPQLQKVYLSTSSSEDSTLSWVAAATWLQQQPKLTNLGFHGGVVEVSVLEQLPPQLEELDLTRVKHPQVQEEQLSALTRLKQLRRLALPLESLTYLPSWLSCLSRLEELSSFCSDVQSGWEVLAALPRLRRLSCSTLGVLLEHAPHLCWVD